MALYNFMGKGMQKFLSVMLLSFLIFSVTIFDSAAYAGTLRKITPPVKTPVPGNFEVLDNAKIGISANTLEEKQNIVANFPNIAITPVLQPKEIDPGTVTSNPSESGIQIADIADLREVSVGTDWIRWEWTNPVNFNLKPLGGYITADGIAIWFNSGHVEVWLNGVFYANITNDYLTVTGLSENSLYGLEIRPVDGQGNTGNWATDEARTLADLTAPAVTFVTPTPNNETIANPFAFVNVTLNETGRNANVEWNGINYTMAGSDANFYLNMTGLVNGNYTFKAYAADFAGNIGISEERWVYVNSINDGTAPASVTDLNETAVGTSWILWNWTNPTDSDYGHLEVYLNGAFYANVSSMQNSINVTGLVADASYEIQTRTADVFDNINANWVNDTARTLAIPSVPPDGTGRGGGGGGGGGTTVNTVIIEVPRPLEPKPNVTGHTQGVSLAGTNVIDVIAGTPYKLQLDAENTDGIADVYKIIIVDAPEWLHITEGTLSIGAEETKQFTVNILAPKGTEGIFAARIKAVSVNNDEIVATYDLTIRVKGRATAIVTNPLTGLITFVTASRSSIAATVGALLITAFVYMYWRSLPETRKKGFFGKFKKTKETSATTTAASAETTTGTSATAATEQEKTEAQSKL